MGNALLHQHAGFAGFRDLRFNGLSVLFLIGEPEHRLTRLFLFELSQALDPPRLAKHLSGAPEHLAIAVPRSSNAQETAGFVLLASPLCVLRVTEEPSNVGHLVCAT